MLLVTPPVAIHHPCFLHTQMMQTCAVLPKDVPCPPAVFFLNEIINKVPVTNVTGITVPPPHRKQLTQIGPTLKAQHSRFEFSKLLFEKPLFWGKSSIAGGDVSLLHFTPTTFHFQLQFLLAFKDFWLCFCQPSRWLILRKGRVENGWWGVIVLKNKVHLEGYLRYYILLFVFFYGEYVFSCKGKASVLGPPHLSSRSQHGGRTNCSRVPDHHRFLNHSCQSSREKTTWTVYWTAVVQWNHLGSGGFGIPERMGSNPGHGLSGDWASTWSNSSQMEGFQIGGLL